jgi:hypothetical protein
MNGGVLEELSFGQIVDEAAIGGQEVVGGKVFERHPTEIVEDAIFDFTFEGMHGEKLQIDRATTAIVVMDADDVSADSSGNAKFFFKFTRERLLCGFSRFDFAAGELPFERHRLIGATLADKDRIAAQNEGSGDESHRFSIALFDFGGHVPSV